LSTGSIGVAVSGLGIGEQHARAFAADARARVIWLHDRNADRARRLAPAIPGSRVASSFEQVLADPGVHVVSVASFDDAHFGQARDALRAGKHVFVEKPLCSTQAELAELKGLWSAAGGRLQIGSNLVLRTAAAYRWLKRSIDAGELGELYAFDGDYLYGRLHKITDGWRGAQEDYSVILGGGVHLIDLMLWLTGQRPVRASAAGNRISTADSGFRYDDFRAATLEFGSGLVARITANFGCVHRHQHVLRVFGTRATFLYDDAGARLHTSRDPAASTRSIPEAALPAAKGLLIPAFLDAVSGQADYRTETQSFFDGISICLACDRAAASRHPEPIQYV
jgi:predicted dehydrogenase